MLAPELNERVVLTYGTPLYRTRLEDVIPQNEKLVELALALREEDRGVQKSNSGGWHSSGNLFARQDPALANLAAEIQKAVAHLCRLCEGGSEVDTQWTASLFGWFNVNEYGDWAEPHHHSGNTWSGVYYVRTGPAIAERPMSGRIEFLDPRVRCDVGPTEGFSHTATLAVTPSEGMLLVFPSYLDHFVHPYYGEANRITLAFNSLVRRKVQPDRGK